MKTKSRPVVGTILLIVFICLNLANINATRFDGDAPTDAAEVTESQGEDQPPVESTPPPPVETELPPTEDAVATEPPFTEDSLIDGLLATEETPLEKAAPDDEVTPVDATVAELLSEVPENTDIVVLDENGEIVPLAEKEAAEIIMEVDPMWCPEGAPLNSPLCRNFTGNNAITQMLTNMRSSTGSYTQNGVIYFTATSTQSLVLNDTIGSLRTNAIDTDYNTLKIYNLTLIGGWNGSTSNPQFSGQTSFGNNSITIGAANNPWVGNITIEDISMAGVTNNNAITVYTDGGDITLNNVDVSQQGGNNYTAFLDSISGDISVQNGSNFDGNNGGNNQNRGFQAETGTGSITISDASFTDARGCLGLCFLFDALVNYNGATVSAPAVTLTNVTANNNDLSGVQISNANSVTLNNVTAINNGTFVLLIGLGSGVNVNGTGSTIVHVNGGILSNNEAYGLSVFNGSIIAHSNPTCVDNRYTGPDPSGCYNILPLDITPPVLSLPADITVEATGPSGAAASYTATANDDRDGPVPVTCTPASGSTFPLGATTVTCTATDSAGNTATGNFNVTVVDTTPPVLDLPGDITAEATGPSGAVVTFTATATDLVDINVPVTCDPPSGSTFPLGNTTVTCSATDNAGNTATGTFNVTVVDTTPPVLDLPNDITAEAAGPSGAAVTYIATATDLVDGNVPVSCDPDSGSTFPLGTTDVACSATDNAGNTATGGFKVTVVDTTPPVLTLPANIIVEATSPSGATATYTATAADLVDGNVPVTCNPPSGAAFPLGTTTVTCSASDSRGNTATGTFTVTVVDTTPPVLTLPANITAQATGPSGAAVSFTATAIDLVDGNVPVTCNPPSGSTFALGSTTVTCSATDNAGNTATGTFTVTVVDTTPPVLNLPANITAEATGPSGAAVTFTATSIDLVDGNVPVTCNPPSGSTFPLGSTTVTCSATDNAGNTATGAFTVTVVDTTPPVLNLPANITAEATGPSGAAVTFTTTATDLVDGNVPVTCNPPSGNTFPLGVTTVTCTTTDSRGNTAIGTFTVTVQDTTPPIITPHSDILLGSKKAGPSVVFYTPPATFDLVDGPGTATCSPGSGSQFALGTTIVTCTATDLHGNAAIPVTFSVTIEREDRTIGVANTFGEIPVTGGDIFDISCTDPAINILQPPGAKVTFIGLCGYQAVLEEVGARALPQSLSQGATFVNGITVTVLQDGNQVDPLPDGTSFLLGLPTPPDSEDKYGILFWDGNKWTELNGQESDDGFFEVSSNQTGFFILVSK